MLISVIRRLNLRGTKECLVWSSVLYPAWWSKEKISVSKLSDADLSAGYDSWPAMHMLTVTRCESWQAARLNWQGGWIQPIATSCDNLVHTDGRLRIRVGPNPITSYLVSNNCPRIHTQELTNLTSLDKSQCQVDGAKVSSPLAKTPLPW